MRIAGGDEHAFVYTDAVGGVVLFGAGMDEGVIAEFGVGGQFVDNDKGVFGDAGDTALQVKNIGDGADVDDR